MRPFTIDDVGYSAQTATVLEASFDKPGNVGPSHDFSDTRFEDFIISGISMGASVRKAAEFGMLYKKGESGIGSFIKTAVLDGKKRHRGRNTNLGISMLFIPLSAACGVCIKNSTFTLEDLRSGVGTVVEGSTPADVIDLYDAIALSDAEVGRSRQFDVRDPNSRDRVLKKGLNLYDILKIAEWDRVACELVTRMEVTFSIGYPSIKKEFSSTNDLRSTILRCFFEILSQIPDTLIERKNNRSVAIEISRDARIILENGLGSKDVSAFDSKLRSDGNKYNPGTTADLTASSLMVALLDGVFNENL